MLCGLIKSALFAVKNVDLASFALFMNFLITSKYLSSEEAQKGSEAVNTERLIEALPSENPSASIRSRRLLKEARLFRSQIDRI